jgi:chemotaxis protein CheD
MTRPLPVGLGEVRVSRDPDEQLCVYGLGSCVAVFLFSHLGSAVGLAHVVLPRSPGAAGADGAEPGRYADRAVPLLVAELGRAGVAKTSLRAAIAGGAAVLGFTSAIGEQNVEAVREQLAHHGIAIEQEDVGGQRGRSVLFDGQVKRLDVRMLSAPNIDI